MSLEIEIFRQHTSPHQFLLQNLHKIQKVLRLTTADVIDGIRRNRETVFALLARRGTLHHAHNALHDVIDISKVSATVSIVKDLDGFALQKLVGKAEVGHVGATCGPIDGEETQPRGRDIVELGIAVGKELVAFLRGGIEAHGVVNAVVGAERHLLVTTIHARARSINQVLDTTLTASLEDVVEAEDVAVDVGIRISDAVAYTGLGGEVHDNLRLVLFKDTIDGSLVSNVSFKEVVGIRSLARNDRETVFFERDIVVIIQVIDVNDRGTMHVF